jgi:nucleoid DNA-binding protein
MEDTIIALLNNNLRVIIPDFGAFIIRQKQPRIIVFNEFLRYNDGILIDFIVKTEGIDREIAEQRVADFAEDGTKLLASGRQMTIEGLGSLKKDSSGKISFIEAPEIIEIENKNTAEPEKIPEAEEKKEIPVIGEQETPEKKDFQEAVEPVIRDKPKSKKPSGTKFKVKKAPGKIKSKRTAKPLSESLPPVVPLPGEEPGAVEQPVSTEMTVVEPEAVVDEAPVEPEAVVDEAPVEPGVVVEGALVEPEAVVDEAPLEPEAVVDEAPVEPEAVVEEAPLEPVAVVEESPLEPEAVPEEAPVKPEAAGEFSTRLTQEAVDAAVAEFRAENKPGTIGSQQTFKPEPSPPGMSFQANGNDGISEKTNSGVSTNRILAWVLIILFVNAGILAWFVFRNKSKATSAGKPAATMVSDSLYEQLADSVRAAAMDSSIVYDEVPVEDDNLKENALAPGSRYYIVAGCFRDEINADSLVSSLKLLGYNAEKFGKIGNLFAVCFASFDNKDLAVSELKKIREKVPSAWMTKF